METKIIKILKDALIRRSKKYETFLQTEITFEQKRYLQGKISGIKESIKILEYPEKYDEQTIINNEEFI